MKKSIEEIKADYHLFIDIQIGKYLSSRNKSEFSNDEEANLVMGKIIETYNDKIASDHLRLDNLNEAAKTSWFNSVEIDYSATGGLTSSEEESPISSKITKNVTGVNRVTKNLISYYNDMFPFLPEGAIIYLMHAGPAFEAYGYPFERFKKIIEGEEPTEIEEDLLLWAYDLSFEIANACLEKNKIEKDKSLKYAITIAEEELDEETALNVVAQIYANYEEDFAELKRQKQSSKAKNKKRKK